MATLTVKRGRRADSPLLSQEWLTFGFKWPRWVPVYRRFGVSVKFERYLSV